MNTNVLPRALAAAAILAVLGAGAVPAGAQASAHLTIASAKAIDPVAQTVTLPLFEGRAAGKPVWYVVTDSSDPADAKRRGVNASPVLAGVDRTATVTRAGEQLVFPAAPDFAPRRVFTPSVTGFPPAAAKPGATSTAAYSPFVRVDGKGPVLNAPIVATGAGPFDVATHADTHDRVVAIDPAAHTVTLLLARGFAGGKPVLYLSTEASDPGAAAIERTTFVPSLGKLQGGQTPILVVANGAGQGLGYTALHGLDREATTADSAALKSPLNVLTTFPTGSTAAAYTPLWAANVGVYTAAAVKAHANGVKTSPAAIFAAVGAKQLTAPGGKPFGPAGFVVNCPVVAYLDAAP